MSAFKILSKKVKSLNCWKGHALNSYTVFQYEYLDIMTISSRPKIWNESTNFVDKRLGPTRSNGAKENSTEKFRLQIVLKRKTIKCTKRYTGNDLNVFWGVTFIQKCLFTQVWSHYFIRSKTWILWFVSTIHSSIFIAWKLSEITILFNKKSYTNQTRRKKSK